MGMMPFLGGTAAALGGCGAAIGMYGPMVAAPYIGYAACTAAVVMMAAPLATLKTVVETKSTAALPLIPSIGVVVNATSWTAYGFLVVHDPVVFIPNGLGMLAG